MLLTVQLLSYLPYGLLLTFPTADINDEGFDSDLQDDFELEVPVLNELCLVLDCLHDFCDPGQAAHSRYSAFLECWQTAAYAVAQAGLQHLHVTL